MILDRKHFSFLVQVIDRGNINTAGGYAEGRVLDRNDEALVNQIGVVYMKRDRIRDL